MDSWARMVRTECGACGSRAIEWHAAVDIPFLVEDLEERRIAMRTVALFGGDAEAWFCLSCGNFGIFSDDIVIPPAPPGASFRRRKRA